MKVILEISFDGRNINYIYQKIIWEREIFKN